MIKKAIGYLAVVLSFAFSTAVSAATIYFADDAGNVGSYDDVADTTAAVGNLGGFNIGQNIGIAWDGANNRILILDRSAPAVYEMDAGTGNAALLFTPGEEFQGGAVKGNTLYGINEGTQRVVAYDLTTFSPVAMSGADLPGHSHGVGIVHADGQLIVHSWDLGIYAIGDDGSIGALLVGSPSSQEDIDGYGSDYLAVDYGNNVVVIDGATGTESELISSVQTASAGVVSSVSGVVLATDVSEPEPALPVPALSAWALLILALLMLALVAVRRKGLI